VVIRRDDGAVVRQVLEGRTELFSELVDRHASGVFRLVRSAIGNPADADDVAQEVFLAAYRALARLRDPARFRSFLLTITARKIADHFRHRRPVASLDEEPAAPEAARPSSLLGVVEDVVARLSPRARLIFALRHHEGLSCVQIAHLLDVPRGTVYSRLSRIHAAIRRAAEVAGP